MQPTNIRAVFILTAWFFAAGTVTTLWSDALSAPPSQPTPGSTPLPVPTVPPAPDLRPSATFTFSDGTQITTQTTTGRFRLVGLHANETVDIALQFPAGVPGTSLMAQPLDGGTILSFSIANGTVASRGLALMRFQAGSQPGLYRVHIPGLGAPLLQFWVADPDNPSRNLPVLNPGH